MKQVTARVISNGEIMPDTYLIWLEALQIASEARPGQFVMVNCGKDTLLPRPLSVYQVDGKMIAFLFRIVGKGTQLLSQCQAGDEVRLFGPLGNGFSISAESKNLLLVAGGIGLAPLYFLAEQVDRRCEVTLLYGTVDKTRYPDFPKNIKLVDTTEDGSIGHKGLVTDLLSGLASGSDQIFACGPVAMYRTMAQMPELKNKPVQVSLEVRMGCGRGLCYGCTVKTKHGLKKVCEDGPVFELSDIMWDELGW